MMIIMIVMIVLVTMNNTNDNDDNTNNNNTHNKHTTNNQQHKPYKKGPARGRRPRGAAAARRETQTQRSGKKKLLGILCFKSATY